MISFWKYLLGTNPINWCSQDVEGYKTEAQHTRSYHRNQPNLHGVVVLNIHSTDAAAQLFNTSDLPHNFIQVPLSDELQSKSVK